MKFFDLLMITEERDHSTKTYSHGYDNSSDGHDLTSRFGGEHSGISRQALENGQQSGYW